MVERGNPTVRLRMHSGTRTVQAPLFDIGLDDTAYPFLLFLSQAETEAILDKHLAQRGVTVERGVELINLQQDPDHVTCTLSRDDGRTEHVHAGYVVGCDGAHSTVRDLAGIPFAGGAYPQTFVLADLDAEGLDAGAVHVHLTGAGMLFFFPLGHPAPWRLLGMRSRVDDRRDEQAPGLDQLQALANTYTASTVRLHEPVWSTYFRLHHRHATRYRSGRVFLAGDAAHIHSPAGAQGMNTGIQDAWNLGWKLALVTSGVADPALLDTYQAERQPVGRYVLRFTDRAFTIATSTRPSIRFLRTRIAPHLIRVALGFRRGRALAFRAVSQLTINYRNSPAVHEGQPRLRHGPHPGDRLPDAPLSLDGNPTTLHKAVAAPGFHLLLAGPANAWPSPAPPALVQVHRLTHRPLPAALVDIEGHAHRRLGLDPTHTAHYLVRPDGHIAYRAAGTNLDGLRAYLQRWLPQADPSPMDGP
jgi:2-polyprenyl-6-methoxyphenol hydroxylase-like FAD-dependent oxidoreductase